MLKALIKKELSQLGSFYFYDKKKGAKRSPGAAALYIIIFVVLFASLGMMFMGLATLLSEQLVPAELDWLYFAMMGLTAVMVGVIGSVFTTHTILYRAKDNESLLAMPIPPSKILFSRMLVVYGFSLLLVMIVWIPTMIRYAAMGANHGLSFPLQLLLMLMLAALVTVLNCVLGWLVALISMRIKNKTAATVILSLVFIGAYYYVYFRIKDVLAAILSSLDKFEAAFRGWGWPLFQLGKGAAGSVPAALIFSLIALGLLAVTYAVLSATLIRILTASHTGKKAVYREKRAEQSSASSALLYKEFKRYTGSATYMLNTGMGGLIMIIAAVALIIKAADLRTAISGFLTDSGLIGLLPIVLVCGVCLIGSMDMVTASSVSLEGKSIWVLQTMPVEEKKVLRAKETLHMLVNCIPSAILLLAAVIVFGLSVWDGLAMFAFMLVFTRLMAAFGLMMNLKKPNLNWTNEVVPVKQGMPVLLSMLLGFAAAGVSFLLGLFLSAALPSAVCIALLAGLLLVPTLLIDRWIGARGAEIFAYLN